MPTIIVLCDCGQKNRVPVTLPAGKTVRCGVCKADISDLDETSLNGDDDDDDTGAFDDED